jgi:hypothetical protein
MAIPENKRSFGGRPILDSSAQPGTLAVLLGGVLAPIGILLWLLPAPFVLPAFSILSIIMSVIVGVTAYVVDREPAQGAITNWDIAGAFMLVGCVAGLLCEPQNVLQLVGEAPTAR